jgi:hypothetical protein
MTLFRIFEPSDFKPELHFKKLIGFKKGPIFVRFSKKGEKIKIPEQDKLTDIDYIITEDGLPIIKVGDQSYPYMKGQPKRKVLESFNNKYILDEDYNDEVYLKFVPKQNDYRVVSKMYNITLNKQDIFVPWGENSSFIKQRADFDSYIAVSLTKNENEAISPRRIKILSEEFYLKKSWVKYEDEVIPDIYAISNEDKWQYTAVPIKVE